MLVGKQKARGEKKGRREGGRRKAYVAWKGLQDWCLFVRGNKQETGK
jgi:hypothetical protein